MAVQWLAMVRRYMMDMSMERDGKVRWRGGSVDEILMECMELHKSAALLDATDDREYDRVIGSWNAGEMRHVVQMSEK